MDERTVTDILAAHADRLNQEQRGTTTLQDVSAEQLVALEPLMRLAERVQSTLAPVQPTPTFVRQLSQQLIATASQSRKTMTRQALRRLLSARKRRAFPMIREIPSIRWQAALVAKSWRTMNGKAKRSRLLPTPFWKI